MSENTEKPVTELTDAQLAAAVAEALELAGASPWLTQGAAERLTELGQQQSEAIRAKRSPRSNAEAGGK